MHCENCGNDNQVGANYCKNCGNKLIVGVKNDSVDWGEGKKEKIMQRSTYFLHMIIAILLVMFARYYEANNDSSILSEDLEALFNIIISFVYLIVVGYRFFFYKKYIDGLNISKIDDKKKTILSKNNRGQGVPLRG